MNDKIFIDTNIWVYFWLKDETNQVNDKNKFIVNYLDKQREENNQIFSSIQIFNELSNVFLKKYKLDFEIVKYYLGFTKELTEIISIEFEDILKAIDIKQKYNLSYFDSLMIQSALKTNCTILYSEDLNHNQIFENKLKVVNPFK
ncbi:MAG: PIN domain-containing protein [Bacteroidetes bacterium]|nr:PIN domain-containing protein [Bacteroidota bacterium]